MAEYDPLEPNRQAVKARVGRLRDPCSRVLDKRAEENGLLVDKGELLSDSTRGALFVVDKVACHRFVHGFCCVKVAGDLVSFS